MSRQEHRVLVSHSYTVSSRPAKDTWDCISKRIKKALPSRVISHRQGAKTVAHELWGQPSKPWQILLWLLTNPEKIVRQDTVVYAFNPSAEKAEAMNPCELELGTSSRLSGLQSEICLRWEWGRKRHRRWKYGEVAQLVEWLPTTQEALSSIPGLTKTKGMGVPETPALRRQRITSLKSSWATEWVWSQHETHEP